ncbi:MAG: hypothetical protein GY789_29050 [Hyphomicrobiales bacterium]|nr:hypothetical protein [Hyphomicrobiales bacterium]MCP5001351.1 hypothetical protein [Hyphomicrobiales bacterium]
MTLTQTHLDAAVARDIITTDQRKALLDLAAEAPNSSEQRSLREEEQFRFITGFNDIFLAIGVVLFIAAAVMTTDLFSFSLLSTTAAALAMWLISEILAVRLRRAIPSMLAAVAFVAFAVAATIDLFSNYMFPDLMTVGQVFYAYVLAGSGCFWASLYYIRFRLPFSLFMIGSAFVGLGFVIVIHAVLGGPENFEAFFSAEKLTAVYALASGLTVFIVAMALDRKDPDRTTLKADYAFWLHLLAAPLIVHALMYLATGRELGGFATVISLQSALAVLGIFVALSIVALVIDRRAILVAALTYLGGALWYLASRSEHAANNAELFSILLIAILVIGLGVGWHSIRRTLFRIPVLRSVESTVLSKQA